MTYGFGSLLSVDAETSGLGSMISRDDEINSA
jgi:hypothetical protein